MMISSILWIKALRFKWYPHTFHLIPLSQTQMSEAHVSQAKMYKAVNGSCQNIPESFYTSNTNSSAILQDKRVKILDLPFEPQ